MVGRNLQQRLESFKLEGRANDVATNHPNRQYWYKPDRERILQDVRMNYSPDLSLKRANLKGLVRKFKDEGWSVDHHRSRGLSGSWGDEIVVSSRTNIEQEYRSVLDGLEL